MKISILSILLLLTFGCSTQQTTPKEYHSEVVEDGYGFTTINYSSQEERTAVMSFVKQF